MLLESQPSSPNVLCGCIIVTERGGLRAVVDSPSVDTGYRLGHLTFAKLKQLALNGEIPKKLAKNQATQVRWMPLRRDD